MYSIAFQIYSMLTITKKNKKKGGVLYNLHTFEIKFKQVTKSGNAFLNSKLSPQTLELNSRSHYVQL